MAFKTQVRVHLVPRSVDIERVFEESEDFLDDAIHLAVEEV